MTNAGKNLEIAGETSSSSSEESAIAEQTQTPGAEITPVDTGNPIEYEPDKRPQVRVCFYMFTLVSTAEEFHAKARARTFASIGTAD